MTRRRENQVARRFRFDAEAVNGAAGQVGERTGTCPNPWLVADLERDLAFNHIERLHVIPMQVKRDALSAFRPLVNQGERPGGLLPGGKKAGRRLTHPTELTLFRLVQIRAS